MTHIQITFTMCEIPAHAYVNTYKPKWRSLKAKWRLLKPKWRSFIVLVSCQLLYCILRNKNYLNVMHTYIKQAKAEMLDLKLISRQT